MSSDINGSTDDNVIRTSGKIRPISSDRSAKFDFSEPNQANAQEKKVAADRKTVGDKPGPKDHIGKHLNLHESRHFKIALLIASVAVILFVLLFIAIIVHDRSVDSQKLIFVYMILRHGDRTPLISVKRIPINESFLSVGFGNITKIGLQQSQELGNSIRKRYFENKYANSSNIFMRSTNLTRTILTAENVLIGMKAENINVMRNFSAKNDSAGNPFYDCPRATEIVDKNLEEERTYIMNNFSEIYSILKREKIEFQGSGYQIHDFLKFMKIYNIEWPSWMNETLMKEFDRVIWIALERLLGMGDYYNETLVRLRGGLILRNAVEEIEKRLNCKDTDNCLYFYGLSAHDVTLVALFSLFNEISQFLGEIPHIGYGANVVFELWNINGQYKIKILYANQYDEEPFPITKFAKGCDGKEEFCDISNFLNASHSLYPSDLIKECASTSREINLDSESDGKLVKRAIETDYLDEILEPLLWM